MKKLGPTEHQIQSALIEWRDLQSKTRPELEWLHAIPNGMRATPEVGAWMAREGMTRGIPDMCLPVPKRHQGMITYCGLYLEVKTEKGRVTPEQRACQQFLMDNSYRVHVIRSVEQGITAIMDYIGKAYAY